MFFDNKGASVLFVIPDQAQRRFGEMLLGSTVYEPKDEIHLKLIDKLLDPGLRRYDGVLVRCEIQRPKDMVMITPLRWKTALTSNAHLMRLSA